MLMSTLFLNNFCIIFCEFSTGFWCVIELILGFYLYKKMRAQSGSKGRLLGGSKNVNVIKNGNIKTNEFCMEALKLKYEHKNQNAYKKINVAQKSWWLLCV